MEILVAFDRRKCSASETCVLAFPDLFELGMAGYARLRREATADDVVKLRQAEVSCPTHAIHVETAEA
jgi:ferredoxin